MPRTNDNPDYVQLPLGFRDEVVIRQRCKTNELYEMLPPELRKRYSRVQIIGKLNRFAREHKNFEVETDEGLWISIPIGKTGPKLYLWKLLFRPSHQAVA